MIRFEADENDLQKLVKIGRTFSSLVSLEKLTNIRITEDAHISFDFIMSKYLPDVSVQTDIFKASETSLYLDIHLGMMSSALNFLVSVCNKDITSVFEQKYPEFVSRESRSRISFNLQTFCRKKLNIPLTVSIVDVSLQQQRLALKFELI